MPGEKKKKPVKDELADLKKENARLIAITEELSQTEEALRASEHNFREMLDQMPIAVGVAVGDKFVFLNKTSRDNVDYLTYQELLNRKISEFYKPEQLNQVKKRRSKILAGTELKPVEQEFFFRDGTSVILEVTTLPTSYEGKPAFLSMGVNITERKRIENDLLDKEQQLKKQAERLREVNTALKVLLDYREQEKLDQEENILSTFKQLVFPYLSRLQSSGLNEDQKTFLEIINSNLQSIVSPLARRLSSPEKNLTPTEVQVAGMIREGQTTKEIASLLNLSMETISFHRKKIRAKLGIANKKINLRTYIESLHQETRR